MSELDYVTLFRKVVTEKLRDREGSKRIVMFLTWEKYPTYAKYFTNEIIEEVCKVISTDYVEKFDFKSLLDYYLIIHGDIDAMDKYVKDAVDKGFAISGSTNFDKFLLDLKDKVTQVTRLFQGSGSDLEKFKHRVDGFISYFAEVYGDIPGIVKYTESLSPKEIDALYMYAYSSAVVNEPFKSASFTKTQKKLEAARRRPTEIQYEYIATMDDIIRNAPKTTRPIYAWRGVAVPSFDVVNLELDIFKSLSLSPDVSRSYLRGEQCCLMRVLVPTGVPIIAMDPVQQLCTTAWRNFQTDEQNRNENNNGIRYGGSI